MEIQFINITSFIDVSAEAEHYYARIASREHVCRSLQSNVELSTLCDTTKGERLIYSPTENEALAIAKKDNEIGVDIATIIDIAKELQEDGTTRFPSIQKIMETAREKFPEAIIIYTYEGSREKFLNLLREIQKRNPDISKLMFPNEKSDR